MPKPRFALSIAQKFVLFILLAGILPLLFVGWFAQDVFQTAIRAQVSHYSQQLVTEKVHYMEQLMFEVESLIANLSTIDAIKQAVASHNLSGDDYASLVTQARIGYILSGYTHMRGLVSIDLFTHDGAHYHVGDTLNAKDIHTKVRDDIYRRALDVNGQVVWIGVNDNVNTNSKFARVTTAAKMLYDTDPSTLAREPAGLLVVNLDPNVFYEHFRHMDLGDGGYLVLVDKANQLVSYPDPNLIGTRVSEDLLAQLPGTSGAQVVTLDATPMFVSYEHSPEYGWLLASFIPLQVITARATELGNLLFLIVVLVVVFVALASIIVVRNVVAPINQITRRFNTLLAGRLDSSLRLPETRTDELGALARGFNSFLDSLLAKQRTEEELRESEERYALAVRGANDGIWDWNLKTDLVYYSPRWKTMLGYAENEIGDAPEEWFERVNAADVVRVRQALEAHVRGETSHFESEFRIRCRDGKYRWVSSRGLSIRDVRGNAQRIAGSQSDITERIEAQERLLYDARYDPLTGLANRKHFLERLDLLQQKFLAGTGALFALLFLDLDRFKVVNDSLGHLAGDRLLVIMARRIEKCLRGDDMVARLGGDEFAIMLHAIRDLGDAEIIAWRLLDALSQPYALDGHMITATASIGIVLADRELRSPEDLMRDADTALYRSKAAGRARFTVFDQDMHVRALAQLELEADLRRAVEKNEFELYYQPIVSLRTGRVARVEALLRWNHPRRGIVSPAEFISLVEETGLIVPLGEWCLKQACRQMKLWHSEYGADFRVAVNLSARQFQDQNLVELAQRVLKETGLPPGLLEVEITERTAMYDLEHTIRALNDLHGMGVLISIDDFGESYSALGYLKRFPIQTLKIDRSFIVDVVTNPDAAAIASGLLAMAHQLSLHVVAEGVENEYQAAFLRSIDCDEVQGYFIARPMPAAQIPQMMQQTFLTELPPLQISVNLTNE